MRVAEITVENELTRQIEAVYGKFDIGLDGLPRPEWEARNLGQFRAPAMLQSYWFPAIWIRRVWVNQRMLPALARVYSDFQLRWTLAEQAENGLNQFTKCYTFGDGRSPNLFWWAGAWELSPKVQGEVLAEAQEIFTRHGFKVERQQYRTRTFEFW